MTQSISYSPKSARHLTRGDPTRPSDGEYVEAVALAHRRRLLPWARPAAWILGEHTPAGPYTYPIGIITVPRQCGKTTLAFDIAMGRGLAHRDYRAAYTAQTGHNASERFRDRFDEIAQGTLAGAVRVRRSQGTERVTLPNGSYVKAFPPIDGALRGSALDLVIVDEAQEIGEDLGRALDQTIVPTFTTRPRRQLLLIGTAGTHKSAYLRRYLDLARDRTPGVALFDYGALEADDVLDETTWAARHPGIGTLTDLDALRAALTSIGQGSFVREYMNVWSVGTDVVIDPHAWSDCRATAPMPAGRPAFAAAVAPDRQTCAIVAALESHVELIDVCAPFDAAGRMRALRDRHRPTRIVIDRASPAGTVADELDRAGIGLAAFTARDYANACAMFAESVQARRLRHTPHPSLDAAVLAADVRTAGDGVWVWSRRGSAGSIAPLEAATLALWAAAHKPEPKPMVYAG